VGIDVIEIFGIQAGILDRLLHRSSPPSRLPARRDVISVTAQAIAADLGIDTGASGLGVLEFFENEHAGPSDITKPSRSLSKGRDASSGASFRLESAFIALKPATPNGQMTASAPPVTTTSHRPY